MGHIIYIRDFEKCIICKGKMGAYKKFTCSPVCFRRYRSTYAKYLARGKGGKESKKLTFKEYAKNIQSN